MSETRAAAMARAARRLSAAGVDGAGRDAELLMRWASGLSGAGLSARLSEAPGEAEAARFAHGVAARAARRPLSHVTGERMFWGRRFAVTPDVLDPRPETETMVAAALDLPAWRRVLDLGVGSGCILLTLLAERAGAEGVGVDASAAALVVAARNRAALGLEGGATLRRGDWLAGVDGAFDLVVCNPPYIAAAEMTGLAPEVAAHEPTGALTPGGDGLGAYRAIAPRLADALTPGGAALFEIGPTQAAAVAEIFAASGWAAPKVLPDLDGRDRCLLFRKSDRKSAG